MMLKKSGLLASLLVLSLYYPFQARAEPSPSTDTPPQAGLSPADLKIIADGRKIAKDKCGRCHNIEIKGVSPLAAAPPFRTLHEKWPVDALEEALGEGIVTSHDEMPEFKFTPEQIDAFLSFLGTFEPLVPQP